MVYVGFRVTPWGSEVTFFGTPEGMQRWTNEQSRDTSVYYAAAFDLTRSSPLVLEVAR